MGYGFGPRAVLGVPGMAWLGTPRGRRFWGERGAHGGRLMAETKCCKAWDETSAQSLPCTLDSWAHSYREGSFVPSLSQTRCCRSLWCLPLVQPLRCPRVFLLLFEPRGAPSCAGLCPAPRGARWGAGWLCWVLLALVLLALLPLGGSVAEEKSAGASIAGLGAQLQHRCAAKPRHRSFVLLHCGDKEAQGGIFLG